MAKESKIKTYDCIVDEIDSEDGGKALIAHVEPKEPKEPEDVENGVFFRIQSWCDDGNHEEFKELGIKEGQKIKITLEIEAK